MLAKKSKAGRVLFHDGSRACVIKGIPGQLAASARGGGNALQFRARNFVDRVQSRQSRMKGRTVMDEADFARRDVQMLYYRPDRILFLMDKEDFQQ